MNAETRNFPRPPTDWPWTRSLYYRLMDAIHNQVPNILIRELDRQLQRMEELLTSLGSIQHIHFEPSSSFYDDLQEMVLRRLTFEAELIARRAYNTLIENTLDNDIEGRFERRVEQRVAETLLRANDPHYNHVVIGGVTFQRMTTLATLANEDAFENQALQDAVDEDLDEEMGRELDEIERNATRGRIGTTNGERRG